MAVCSTCGAPVLCLDCGNVIPSGSPMDQRMRLLEETVRLLADHCNMKRDTSGDWWSGDWDYEVKFQDEDMRTIVDELLLEGRAN